MKIRTGMPPSLWMRRAANSKFSNADEAVDYKIIAKRFGTTVRAIRSLSIRIRYPSYHVPNPKGGTIKKFKLSDFIKAIREHVEAYKWPA